MHAIYVPCLDWAIITFVNHWELPFTAFLNMDELDIALYTNKFLKSVAAIALFNGKAAVSAKNKIG